MWQHPHVYFHINFTLWKIPWNQWKRAGGSDLKKSVHWKQKNTKCPFVPRTEREKAALVDSVMASFLLSRTTIVQDLTFGSHLYWSNQKSFLTSLLITITFSVKSCRPYIFPLYICSMVSSKVGEIVAEIVHLRIFELQCGGKHSDEQKSCFRHSMNTDQSRNWRQNYEPLIYSCTQKPLTAVIINKPYIFFVLCLYPFLSASGKRAFFSHERKLHLVF